MHRFVFTERERVLQALASHDVLRTALLLPGGLGGAVAAGDGGAYTGSNYSRIIWAFFIFQQWAERYL